MASLSFFHPSRSNTTTSSPAPSAKSILTINTRTLRSPPSLDAYTNISSTDIATTRRSDSYTSLRKAMAINPSSSQASGSIKSKTSTVGHAKLHKRGGSGGSLPGPPSPFASTFSTPFATYEEPSTGLAAAPKIKPYLRKMSSTKEDQGLIDLSKSAAENDRLAGLGIHDFSNKSATDVAFAHNRRQHHGRKESTGSQVSNGSGTFRISPGQPFTHPMAKVPRPYTPPAGVSHASSWNEEEANESDDVVEDEFRLGNGFRSRRSVSVSSVPQNNPTPLSQSYTAGDFEFAPKHFGSQSNLSMMSKGSDKSKHSRPRRDTDMSLLEHEPSSSSRPSLDKAFSLVSRRSDTEPQSRDELIRAARLKFEEKEASKLRKDEKRRERQRQKSDVAEYSPHTTTTDGAVEKRRRKSSLTATAGAVRDDNAKFRAKSYEEYQPAHATTLPRYGDAPGESEKRQMQHAVQAKRTVSRDGTWMRFSTWFQTRMLSCGGGRR